jgi:hypothetical protein
LSPHPSFSPKPRVVWPTPPISRWPSAFEFKLLQQPSLLSLHASLINGRFLHGTGLSPP